MARRATSTRTKIIIGALIGTAALLLAVQVASPDGDRTEVGQRAPRASGGVSVPAGEAGPVTEEAGMAVGYSRGAPGAEAAAVSFATAPQRWLYFTNADIGLAVARIATPTARARLTDDVVAEVAEARERLGESPGRVWWLVRPLATNVEAHSGHGARVAVWVVTVLSAVEVAAPQTEWMTVTVDLAWDGDWRVDAVHQAPGPTPMIGPGDRPWDAEPFDDGLAGFTRLDVEPVR